MRILTDADIDRLPLGPMIDAVRAHIAADAKGGVVAPARHVVEFGEGSLVFTIGGDPERAGFRVYQTFAKPGHPHDDQIVAAWEQRSGEMLGLAIGNRLGALRTGIIGAVAVERFAPTDARVLTVVGTGRQAETQMIGIAAARTFAELRVAGRRSDATRAFAARLTDRIDQPVVPFTDPRAALDAADVVILATTATEPVIDAGWVAPHAYAATLGPKSTSAHELPMELAARAGTIVTDSPQQIAAMGGDHMLSGHEAHGRIRHLGDLLDGGKSPVDGPVLFLSIGLAGTEVACLAAALAAMHESR